MSKDLTFCENNQSFEQAIVYSGRLVRGCGDSQNCHSTIEYTIKCELILRVVGYQSVARKRVLSKPCLP